MRFRAKTTYKLVWQNIHKICMCSLVKKYLKHTLILLSVRRNTLHRKVTGTFLLQVKKASKEPFLVNPVQEKFQQKLAPSSGSFEPIIAPNLLLKNTKIKWFRLTIIAKQTTKLSNIISLYFSTERLIEWRHNPHK